MASLVTYHFLMTTEVLTPLEVDEHCGSALRGNLFEALWRRFCNNRQATRCVDCVLHALCPVSALVAPLREEHPRGRDVPRPYIILPPLGEPRRYEPGEEFLFGLTLFGNIVDLLPYVMLSMNTLGAAGLGRRVQDQQGQRGKFVVKQVEAYHPLSGERQRLYHKGKTLVNAATLAVTEADVQAKAAGLSPERITLDFLTPTRLIEKEHLLRRAAFPPLIHRLLERLSALEQVYGTGDMVVERDEQRLLEQADQIQCVEDVTRWEDVASYSRRLKRSTPVGGLLGKATFSGNLTPFRDLLVWGELIHAGKSCVKGNGWYKIALQNPQPDR